VAEWLRSGLQSRLHRFDSGRRLYRRRQFTQIDPRRFADAGDARVAVAVHQVVRALDGSALADREVTHVYSFRDGLITRMDVSDSPA
jgi:hypothetical protein